MTLTPSTAQTLEPSPKQGGKQHPPQEQGTEIPSGWTLQKVRSSFNQCVEAYPKDCYGRGG